MDKENKNAGMYPGVATDIADNETVNKTEVKEEVKELNNNPRNTDDKMP